MRDTYVEFSPDSSWADRVVTEYTWHPLTGRYELFWAADQPQRWAFFPAGLGLWGSAPDYAKFLTLWFDLGVVEGHRLVSEESIRSALTPHGFFEGEPVYGYGWFVDATRTEGDDGAIVTLGPGDVVVQNGTAHAWYNGGEEGAVLAAVMVGGQP